MLLGLYSDNHYAEVLEKVTPEELAWFGGIVDGEGSVSVQATIRNNGNLVLVPFVTVVNSDQGIIDKIDDILNRMDIKHYWYQRKPVKNKKTNDNPEPSTVMIRELPSNLRIEKMNRVKAVLNAIQPYLFGVKKKKAEYVLNFIKSRNENLIQRNSLGQIVRNKYTKKEVELCGAVRTSWSAKPLEELMACNNIIQEQDIVSA